MTTPIAPAAANRASLRLRIGKRGRLAADVAVTGRGLISIGVLVSSILLSSAAVVVAGKRPVPVRRD